MLTYAQIRHFQTFGYLVLPAFLSATEATALRAEVSDNLAHAFEGLFEEQSAELPGLLLPTMSSATPFGRGYVADDTRFWDAAHLLLGRQCVPTHSEANCFYRSTGWHADFGIEVPIVKFMAYLDPAGNSRGALQVIPGSQRLDQHEAMWSYLSGHPGRRGCGWDETSVWPVPSVSVPVSPGDVIAFDGNLLHASAGSPGRRLAWNVQYLGEPAPGPTTERANLRDLIAYSCDTRDYPYDHEKWPVWKDWLTAPDQPPSRRTAAARLRRLGVFDIKGIETGEPIWEASMASPFDRWATGIPASFRPDEPPVPR